MPAACSDAREPVVAHPFGSDARRRAARRSFRQGAARRGATSSSGTGSALRARPPERRSQPRQRASAAAPVGGGVAPAPPLHRLVARLSHAGVLPPFAGRRSARSRPSSASSSCVAGRPPQHEAPPSREMPRRRWSASSVTSVPPSASLELDPGDGGAQHLRERRVLDLLLPRVGARLASSRGSGSRPARCGPPASRSTFVQSVPGAALALLHVLDARHLRPPARQVVRVGDDLPDRRARSAAITRLRLAFGIEASHELNEPAQVPHEQQVLEVRDDGGQALERLDRLLAGARGCASAAPGRGSARAAPPRGRRRSGTRAGCAARRRSGSARPRRRTISRSRSS